MVRRCLKLVVNREFPLIFFWKDERLDMRARGLMSQVMVVASQSFIALTLCF